MSSRWAGRGVAACVALQLSACYSYMPLVSDAQPIVGARYALHISDQGRVALAERFGLGLSRVDGRLTQVTPQEFGLAVFRVEHLGNQASTWGGEGVRIDRGLVARIDVRRVSRKRSFVAGGAVAAVAGYFIATRGLAGLFTGDRPEPDVPGPATYVGLTHISR